MYFLIFYSSMTSLYCFIIQNNMYTLERTMKFAIMNKFPLELRGIYIEKYFCLENFPPPSPTQLPHISYSRIYSQFFMVASAAFLIATLIYFSCYTALYMAVAVDIWKNARLGIWSYVILTRMRMPYRDYTVLHEFRARHKSRHRSMKSAQRKFTAKAWRIGLAWSSEDTTSGTAIVKIRSHQHHRLRRGSAHQFLRSIVDFEADGEDAGTIQTLRCPA
ncbi:hypothetical protein PMI11_07202 [Rhizobium sp. CF142]|nr:hypothetical protein PMI11_07202 [Rhizobium sp. CF142]